MGLIISRKNQESISIGDSIVVQVVKLGKGRVGLRVIAPKEVKVMRSEINQQVQSNAFVPMNRPSAERLAGGVEFDASCFSPGRIEEV